MCIWDRLLRRINAPHNDAKRSGVNGRSFFSHFTLHSSPQIAFTLAEVLITLGIIGVVAALVIPALHNYTQKLECYSALKKEYSVLSEATKKILIDNGNDLWDSSSTDKITRSLKMRDEYAAQLKYTKLGTLGEIFNYTLTSYDKRSGTFNIPTDQSKPWMSGFFPADNYAITLNDGSIIAFIDTGKNCSYTGSAWGETQNPVERYYCGYLQIDVNGIKPPNRIGVDVYSLWVVKDAQNNVKISPPRFSCGYNSLNGDSDWWLNGFGCSKYVLLNQSLPSTAQSP